MKAAQRRAAGHQTALALLRLGSGPAAARDRLLLIDAAAEDRLVLVSLISGLLDFVEQMATAHMGTAAWETFLAKHIADLAFQQTKE